MRPRTIPTAHGPLPTLTFLPDATRGAVRATEVEALEAVGVEGLMVNSFHLQTRPGADVIRRLGGLHDFIGWRRPLVTDSGGFQALSLIRQNASHGVIRPDGLLFRQPGTRRKMRLTPEKSIQTQFRLGSDVMIALDDCTHPDDPLEEQRRSVERTIRWAAECKREYLRQVDERGLDRDLPALVGVVQGGNDEALRTECAQALVEIGFDAFGFGGWPIDGDGQLQTEAFGWLERLLPPEAPRFALGVGKPEHLATLTALGGRYIFDCSLPTRDARRGRLLVLTSDSHPGATSDNDWYRYLYLYDDEHRASNEPIDPSCDGPCCSRYSRAYLHHLFKTGEALGQRLATLHNLRFYTRLIEHLETA